MQALRSVIHIMLVLAILAAGMPVHQSTDANRDERTDLADAILRVKELAGSAERPQNFLQNLKEALLTLKVVSGLSKLTKYPGNHSITSQVDSSPYILTSYVFPEPLSLGNAISIEGLFYQSRYNTPPVPPPKV